MRDDAKVALLRQGRYVLNNLPQVATSNWTEREWIDWIDLYGSWVLNPVQVPVDCMVAFGHSWKHDPATGKYRLQRIP